jgi:hypothetical protein
MKAMLKRFLGWDQRSDPEKVAVRGFRYRLTRALGLYLVSDALSFFPIPRFKRNLASLYVEKAVALRSEANPIAAMQAARHAVTLCPDVLGGYDVLSNIMLPGQPYFELLRRFHDWLRPKSYIEIGVSTGASIVLAKPPTVAVGIDPEPRLLNVPNTVCKLFPLTSDDYFAARDPRRDIEAETVDLAFIDGLHLLEQALRDFINIERISSPTTLILIHDCFAIDALTAARERQTSFWTGDVWKIIPCLREFRTDLNVFTIAAPPAGLGVVSRLDANSTVLTERFEEIVAHYAALEVDSDEVQRRQRAAMVPNDWQEVVSRLADVVVSR